MATLDFTGLLHAIFLLWLQDVLIASFYLAFTKALPLLREALTAGLVSSLPNLGDDDYQERTTLQ